MNNRWSDMSIGERVVLASWMAVREHMAAEEFNVQRSTLDVQDSEMNLDVERWTLNVGSWTLEPDETDDDAHGDIREGAD